MARKRQVDPIFPHDSEISSLSIPARYFYILSWCHMSDPNDDPKKKHVGGVLPYDIQYLKKSVFPEENVDVGAIVQELIDRRRYLPFEAQGKQWLWCPTLAEHQVVNHPSSTNYPEPPVALQEDYRSGKVALTQSRESRVERVEIKDQPLEKLKAALDKVLKDGFNIYQLIGRLKKELKWKPEQMFPEEVLLGVCGSYEKNKTKIKDQWAWFKVAIRYESELYFAAKNIEEHRKIKDQKGLSLGEILRRAEQHA